MPGPYYFAWAGGTIQDQVTLVTNGNTHGGVIKQFSVVGDLLGSQLVNMASQQGLDTGLLYEITGPNLGSGTFFIMDNSILTGAQPGSVNLSNAPSGNIQSATFQVKAAITVAEVIATVSSGSSTVIFSDPPDLAPGIYGISGEPIGQTTTPVGTTIGTTFIYYSGQAAITTVPSAFFVYTGGASITMQTWVAVPYTTTRFDQFGQPLEHTTYSVSTQDVTALGSGEFPLQIAGMPDGDWYSVTGFPTGVLETLTAGLRYNITGNGLQPATTFVAPSSGNAIELDLAATSSTLNAILTITGPRTPNAAFDPTIHDRFDEEVLSFEIVQEEGNFARLTIDLKNPAVGLLALGRNLWCWLSYDSAWTPGGTATPDLVPLFNGMLIGVPKLQASEVIKLEFLARPDDLNVQKVALSQSLQVLPFWDPVWLAANVNPDTVLETYSALFHIDRVTLAVTVSDILQGEDGTITIGEDQAFYDGFELSYGEPPLVAVNINGTVTWTQEADGFVNVTSNIFRAFQAAHSTPLGFVGGGGGGLLGPVGGGGYGFPFYGGTGQVGGYGGTILTGGQIISMLNGDGLYQDWPKPGTTIGGGWSLSTLTDPNGSPYCYIRDANRPVGWITQHYYNVNTVGSDPSAAMNNDFALAATNELVMFSYQWKLSNWLVRMILQYKASRKRTESVSAVLVADVQRELSDTAESDRGEINLTSEYVAEGVDPGGGIPIGDISLRSYFQTDRGAGSFEYLLLLARAKMRARARSVDVKFAVNFATAIGITLRNSITLFDRRLPGGSATGKVKSYRIIVGESGQYGEFTIGCSIGNGNTVTAAAGENSYVNDGYVNVGYQVIAGGQYMLLTGELAYQSLDNFVIDDDGIDFSNFGPDTAVNECIVTNGLKAQLDAMRIFQGSGPGQLLSMDPNLLMKTLNTTVLLDMKPVAGSEFHTDFTPAVSLLALPKTIDLSATSGEERWDTGQSRWDDQ